LALSAVGIKKAGPGRYGDGGGLELHKSETGGKWIWRYSFGGKRRQMGLGSYPAIGLADARKERDRWNYELQRGRDPITERAAQKAAVLEELNRDDPTLADLTLDVLEAKKAGLRKEGKAGRWISPLETHVFPKIGNRPISTIKPADVKAALAPIWRTKHPTAEKAIQRLHIVFRNGKLMGFECDPFTIEAAKHMLGEVNHKTAPIPATPWQDTPDLYQRLEGRGRVARCLQFMMLTLVRASGCRLARFEEFDGNVWTIPADRIKGKEGQAQDFRVPLSAAAMEIIEHRRMIADDFVFLGYRDNPITDSSLSKHMREMGEEGRPHGFRTSFRTWVQDNDVCSYDVAETILGHSVGNKVERSYARSDLLERRAPVMEAWAQHVTGAGAGVVRLRR